VNPLQALWPSLPDIESTSTDSDCSWKLFAAHQQKFLQKISRFFVLESWLRVYGTRSRKGGVTATLTFLRPVLESRLREEASDPALTTSIQIDPSNDSNDK
jgi:hypothetical protein